MVSFRGKIKVGPHPGWSPPGLVHEYTLHLKQAFDTLLEEMKLDTDVHDETFSLQLELVFFRAYSCLLECNQPARLDP